MSEIKSLLWLELRSIYGINKLKYTKGQKTRSRGRLLSLVWVLLIGMVFVYIGALSFGLCSLGLSEIVPAYLAVLASAFILFFGLFSAGNRVFGERGYDILASMPLKSSSIVLSRMFGLYIADLILTVVIFLPGVAVYGYCQSPNALFYVLSAVGALFVPIIPLVISVLFGTVILAISSRMKRKSAVQSLLNVIMVIGIMTLSFGMDSVTADMTAEQFFSLAKTIGAVFSQVYPPAMWLNSAVIDYNALNLLLFAAVSTAVMALALAVVAKNYHSIVRRLLNFTAKHNYKIRKMESRSTLKALYMRELKRYFSSGIYVSNTIIGPILATAMAVAICVVGIDTVKASIPLPIDVAGLLPFVFSAVLCMMTVTSVAISMEGRQFWIVKSLPISTKMLLDSKILFNLSLLAPFYIISQIALIIAVRPDLAELLWMLVIPLITVLFVLVFGITVNLKFHSFDWDNEATVVKQSLPSALGGFAGPVICIAAIIVILLAPEKFSDLVKLLICVIVAGITALLYRKNNKAHLVNL